MATLKMDDCLFKDCGKGITIEGPVQVDLTRTNFINVAQAIEVQDTQSIIQMLGLPADTPQNLLIEAINAVRGNNGASADQKLAELKKTRFSDWLSNSLQNTANVATILQSLLSFIPK